MTNVSAQKISNAKIKINLEECTKCEACIKACPAQLYYMGETKLEILEEFEDSCIECGHCVAICPVNVIQLRYHEGQVLKDVSVRKDLPSIESYLDLVLSRRSIRQFKEDPIPRELIDKLLEIGRYSPTASNTENLYFTVVQDKNIVSEISKIITKQTIRFVQSMEIPEGREKLRKIMPKKVFEDAVENLPRTKRILMNVEKGIDFWCWNAEIISIHGDEEIGAVPTNCSLAAAYIMLGAELLGLATCSLGYLTYFSNQNSEIKDLLKIPENHQVGYSMAIGFPRVRYKRIPARKSVKATWI